MHTLPTCLINQSLMLTFEQEEIRNPFFAAKRFNRRKCMWAYLVGLGVLALILVTSHQPRSGFDPRAFVDDDDQLENNSKF